MGCEETTFHGDVVSWTLVLSDFATFVAYVLIPVHIFKYVISSGMEYSAVLSRVRVCFILFICSCGVTHLLTALQRWFDLEMAMVLAKVNTALVSILTVAVLVLHTDELELLLQLSDNMKKELEDNGRELEDLRLRNVTLAKLKREAMNLVQSQEEFIASVTHEIRTPLQSITGCMDVLSGTPLDDEQRDLANMLRNSSELLARIIDDILDFSKYENCSFELEHEPFEVQDVLFAAARMSVHKAEQRRVKLRYHIDDGVAKSIYGDAARLTQTLSNLVSNAIKFTDHGEVAIEVSSIPGLKDRDDYIKEMYDQYGTLFYTVPLHANDDVTIDLGLSDDSHGHLAPDHTVALDICIVERPSLENNGGTEENEEIESGAPLLGGCKAGNQNNNFANLIPRARNDFHARKVMQELPKAHQGRWLRIVVRDTGIGIPRGAFQRIFKKFMQTDNSTTRIYGGTGLGLSIVKTLVHKMGGSLHLQSQHGKGSQFILIIPMVIHYHHRDRENPFWKSYHRVLTMTQTPTKQEEKQKPSASTKQMETTQAKTHMSDQGIRILVTDDNPVNCKVARKMLCKLGVVHPEQHCSNGQEALDFIANPRNGKVDAILMDLHMPVMDGREATTQIRARNQDVLVFVFSASTLDEEDVEKLKQIGFDGLVLKPVSLDKLRKLIGFVSEVRRGSISRTSCWFT